MMIIIWWNLDKHGYTRLVFPCDGYVGGHKLSHLMGARQLEGITFTQLYIRFTIEWVLDWWEIIQICRIPYLTHSKTWRWSSHLSDLDRILLLGWSKVTRSITKRSRVRSRHRAAGRDDADRCFGHVWSLHSQRGHYIDLMSWLQSIRNLKLVQPQIWVRSHESWGEAK